MVPLDSNNKLLVSQLRSQSNPTGLFFRPLKEAEESSKEDSFNGRREPWVSFLFQDEGPCTVPQRAALGVLGGGGKLRT